MNEVAIGIGFVAFAVVVLWVLMGATRRPPQLDEIGSGLPPNPSDEWLKTAYNATTSLFVETDREIWQIATIFTSASLLIMGWVATNLEKLDIRLVVVAGYASILLVGVATLFKHRLRIFNLVHAAYLRRLEQGFVRGQEAAEYWGLHHIRMKVKAGRNLFAWATSIHGIMDIYFFLFTAIWVALWVIASA